MVEKVNRCKAHSLTGRITLTAMHDAFKRVKRNRGAAGIDKVSIAMFEANLEQNLLALMSDLKAGAYQPLPARRSYVPKRPNGRRPLGIPVVRDRVAQAALVRLLEPLFEERFHDDSFGFRPGRNCRQAIERILELHRLGHKDVLDADIKGCFDNILHEAVMAELSGVVADGNILRLVERFLKAGVMEKGVFRRSDKGTPQGGVISPLLANIALDRLDRTLAAHGLSFVRYADDFVVLCRSDAQAEEALQLVRRTLAEQIGLELSTEKTRVTTFQEGFCFLGFDITSRSVRMRAKSVEGFKAKVRDLTVRRRNLDREAVVRLNWLVRGTANYFAAPFAKCVHQFRDLDRWMRMRLRCMKHKRKSREDNLRMRKKHLKRMGVLMLSDFLPAACAA